jgi:NAD(P)H-dependent flavin oxidoreductase YrpB (nitropropane dioxygenase family)
MAVCAKWKVPIVITSLGAREELNHAVHDWGGITLHDVIDDRFARKAVDKGADGLIAVAAGAGGHAGRCNRERKRSEQSKFQEHGHSTPHPPDAYAALRVSQGA